MRRDRRCGEANDRVLRVLDHGCRHVSDADVANSVEDDGFMTAGPIGYTGPALNCFQSAFVAIDLGRFLPRRVPNMGLFTKA